VGATGPAGGIIVFVDYRSEYADFDYLEAAASDASQDAGVVWAPKIQLASSNATLSGTSAAGGVTPSVGDRILLRYQTTTSENGIYTVNSGAWTLINTNQTTGCYGSNGTVGSCANGFAYDAYNNGGVSAYYVATAAIGMGKTNTNRLVAAEDSQGTSRSTYLAGRAKDYSTVANGLTYADWFLPSSQEAVVMVTALAAFGRLDPQYNGKYLATSSEVSATQYVRMYPFILATTTGAKDSATPAMAGDRHRFMRRFSNESSPAQTAYACNAPAAQICGATGTSPCIVGATGPAGGTIVFVDYDQEYASFDYLEAGPIAIGATYAPTGRRIYPQAPVCYSAVGAAGVDCAPTVTPTSTVYSSDYAAQEIASTAVGVGQSNTDLMYSLFGPSGANVDGATYLAGIVKSYTTTGPSGATYQDWFIPSLGESRIMANALSQLGRHDASSSTSYVTSSEASLSSMWTFPPGTVSIPATSSRPSTTLFNVRPMRMFSGATGATVSFNYLTICGASGTDPCTLGATGPGGGIIVYVDTAGVYAGFDYLEASADYETGNAAWRFAPTASSGCFTTSGSPVNGVCTSNSIYTAATRTASVQAASALGMGSANTQGWYSVMSPDAASTSWGAYAAYAANLAVRGGKNDWFVPSSSEAVAMVNYLRSTGRYVPMAATASYLLTSTEYETNTGFVMAVNLNTGVLTSSLAKSTSAYLRLMRKF